MLNNGQAFQLLWQNKVLFRVQTHGTENNISSISDKGHKVGF